MTISICLLLLQTGLTQISDSLYAALPDSVKPVNKKALTPAEQQLLLKRAGFDLQRKYYAEVNELADRIARETAGSSDTDLIIKNYLALAGYYYCVPSGNKSFVYYRNMIDAIGDKKKYIDFLFTGYKDIGGIYGYSNRKDSAVWYVHKALDIAREKNDSAAAYSCYEIYSGIYYDMQLYDKAIDYNNLYRQSLKGKDFWGISYTASLLFNANCYERLFEKTGNGNYGDSLLQIVSLVLQKKRNDSTAWKGACYYFTGSLLYSRREFSRAGNYLDSSLLHIYRDNDMYFRTAAPKYFLKALCLIRTGNYTAGKKIIDSLRLTDFSDLKQLNEALYEYAESKGQWKEAFRYHEEFIRYSDSMNVVGLNGFVFDAEQKYTIVEKQAAITRLENENLLKEKESVRLTTVSIFSFLILLIIIVVLYGMYRRSQLKRIGERQQLTSDLYKMEADMNDERAVQQLVQQSLIENQRRKISENIHDEIMSGMAALRYRIAYNKNKMPDEKAKDMLAGMEEDTLALYLQAKDFLANLNKEPLTGVAPHNVMDLLHNLNKRFSDEKVLKVVYNCDTEKISKYFTAHIHHELYLVVKEAIANIIRHAGAYRVFIGILFEGTDCKLTITDNGRGFDKSKITSGIGLQSIESRIKALNGILEISSDDNGTQLKASFPVAQP